MGVKKTTDPFRFQDDEEKAKLRATPHALTFVDAVRNDVQKGEMIGQSSYSHHPIKTTLILFHPLKRQENDH